MERPNASYALLGAAEALERRSRGVVALGVRAAGVAAVPAVLAWRSPLAAPVRARAEETGAALARDGQATADRLRESARVRVDDLATAVINHPATEALISKVVEDPGVDRLVARVLDSHLVDELTARLLDSDEMRLILDHVTRSPELRAALAEQTAGLAGDVAAGVRSRTVVADAATERFARSLLRRRPRTVAPAGDVPAPPDVAP